MQMGEDEELNKIEEINSIMINLNSEEEDLLKLIQKIKEGKK